VTGNRIPPVPPGSTALRQVALGVDGVLALPRAATERDELTYLRCLRDRVRLVRQAMADILADPGIEQNPADVMAVVINLRQRASALGDDHSAHQPEPTP
jgi:hypothetical protein